ncbi:MAG: hypothetical protein MI750_14360 [Xanthomonadales bacterium]|jgi:hypothetical protein|nr:hypothetical protein [Xanthomonadales bacterium]
MKRLTLIAGLCLVCSGSLMAAGEQGTGFNIHVAVSSDHRVILQAQDSHVLVVGSETTESDFTELTLDALSEQGIIPEWGKAEVVLGCFQADVQLFQNIGDDWQEVAASQVPTSFCGE